MVDPNNVKSVFLAASEKLPAERAAFLEEAAAGDAALRLRVEALLQAHDNPDSFLQQPAVEFGATVDLAPVEPSPVEAPGAMIGRYKLLQQIGEGGFGVVFMAEQEVPVRRLVALKIIKAGMDTRQVVARFEAERQALAMMDHPCVAKVLDGGATATGRLYFVMELVKGIPITEYCDKNNLSIEKRLELFGQVCQAVQHAHQKGLIHRDIKPSNVLVSTQDDRPAAKVIDFGVAKAVQARLTEKTLFTEFQQLVGTPAYMSPEQADGNLDIDTRSDVYSLGVLLYELLAGSPPFDPKELRSKAFAEMQRIIREVEPPTPSTRLSTLTDTLPTVAAQRSVEPRRLAAIVRGELDWIVMRCLEKDRKRRYQTASSLADDLERYLIDQPTEARPATRLYRLKKFARRNKVVMFAGSAIAGTLILGLGFSTWMFVRERVARVAEAEQRVHAEANEKKAQTEAAKSQQVAKFLTDMLEAAGPAVARGRDATLLREILDKTSERVETDLADQAEVQGELWLTLGDTYSSISDLPRAVVMYQHAVNSFRVALGDDNPKLALALGALGINQSLAGDFGAGKANAQLGLEMARKCGDQETLAKCLSDRALAGLGYGMRPPSPENVPLLREAVAIWKQRGNDPDALAGNLVWLALSLGDSEEAEALAREALAVGRDNLPSDNPRLAALLHNASAVLVECGKLEQAESLSRESVELVRKLWDESSFHHVRSRRRLTEILARREKWDEAEALVREGMKQCARSPTDEFARAYSNMLVRLKASRGQLPEALKESAQLVKVYPHDHLLAINRTIVMLQAGDQDGYRRLCHDLVQRDLDEPNKVIVAKLALLLPVDGADFGRACEWADAAAVATKVESVHPEIATLAHLAKALADYRRDRFHAADTWAQRVTADPSVAAHDAAAAWIIRAMAAARRQQAELGRDALARGVELLEKPHVDFIAGDTGGGHGQWMIAVLLRRESGQHLGVEDLGSTSDGQSSNNKSSPFEDTNSE